MNLESRAELSASERGALNEMIRTTRLFPAKTDIVSEGDTPKFSCLMLSGLSARYNMVGDGKRQISAVHIPGDFVDLHSLLINQMDHSVGALIDCEVALVPHEVLRESTVTHPRLMRLLWLLTIVDGAIFRQGLVAAARLPAESQIARFLCEIYVRLSTVGLTDGREFDLPITQADLSDAMGLSQVHVNKCLQKMRREGLMAWQGSRMALLDWKRLEAMAEFDSTYLNLDRRPR